MNFDPLQRAGAVPVVTEPRSPDGAAHRELIVAVKAVNASEAFGNQSELTYAFERGTHRVVARLVDKKTGELIAEIPSAEVRRLARSLAAAAKTSHLTNS